jgi:hypothetical protein
MGAARPRSDGWVPARLIPTAGIKGAKEQEQRATSALLAVIRAVPEFGRELLSDLGAPRGNVETFTEIALDDGSGGALRPDGAVLVTRGKQSWAALVEVKTRRNQSDREQVIRYLDAAAREGFDGVLLIDNEILGGAHDVPVDVPRSKLRKADLWQLSWWRIVTEAILQHDHRGVSDPDQAWILSELIAYLLHESSGVAELDDMGPSWIKVRDGTRHDTLTPRQPEVKEIARRWEQFIHYVALGLTQELGRDVTPYGLRKPLEERISDTVEGLAERSQLTMALTVPDAVGPLSLVADLRARMVTTGVTVKAPKEGRPLTQIRWVLRQLRDAPDDLRLETKFTRTSQKTTALLREVREQPKDVLLHNDPSREPREFNLSLARPMGIKKGTGPGAFITDTRQQAVDFYRDLMQHLTDWRPRPPRLKDGKRPATTKTDEPADTPDWSPPPPSRDIPETADDSEGAVAST